jgi:hypothetical protein
MNGDQQNGLNIWVAGWMRYHNTEVVLSSLVKSMYSTISIIIHINRERGNPITGLSPHLIRFFLQNSPLPACNAAVKVLQSKKCFEETDLSKIY